MAEEKESFVSSSDRPTVGLHPDTPISELRVRDLQALLQGGQMKKIEIQEKFAIKEFKEKDWKEKDKEKEKEKDKEKEKEKDWKEVKDKEKEPHKDLKEWALEKFWDLKQAVELPPFVPGGIDQVIQTISGLNERVTQLTREVEQLKQKSSGQ